MKRNIDTIKAHKPRYQQETFTAVDMPVLL